MPDHLYVGLMSGTSADGIDAALVRCGSDGDDSIELLATRALPLADELKAEIATLSHTGPNEIERLGVLDRELGEAFAGAVNTLLAEAEQSPNDVRAIGSHGQTLRHRPPSAGNPTAFTLQAGDPNTIAERTGITVVADFRRRDIAAGGEGAPLAPAFHAAAFASADHRRAIVNIGGISNATLLDGKTLVGGYDTGPGNTLLDYWVLRHEGKRFDQDGAWSAEGDVSEPLLAAMLSEEYFALDGPRSTGKEAFNPAWLDRHLAAFPDAEPRNVQATLAELTARCIADAIQAAPIDIDEVYVCGGGASNTDLMRRLYRCLEGKLLTDTSALGISADWVEAVAFAWLAHQTMEGLAGNAPAVTGASGLRVLGGIYPAGTPGADETE